MLNEKYLDSIYRLIMSSKNQFDTIEKIGKEIAECIMNEGIIHTWQLLMLMKKFDIIIGVDGGATSTRCVITNT